MKRSIWIPSLLLIYLAVMSYIGRGELAMGHYAYYFGLIALTLLCILLLHRHLRRRENSRSDTGSKS